jgi:capsular polysaccharide export protein
VKILLLQGPFGGFFTVLARELQKRGHEVRKINFNSGDWAFSFGFPSINYRKGHHHWREWLRDLITEWSPDAIILFGDQRPIHRVAIQVAKVAGVPVYCFEEGYVRPDYVTFEKDGNNANSPVPRNAKAFAGAIEPEPAEELPTHFDKVAWTAIFYFFAKSAGRWLFPKYVHHRRRPLFREAAYWIRCYTRLLQHKSADEAVLKELTSDNPPPYFLVALQVHDDMQLLRHGMRWRNPEIIWAAAKSFAEHAAPHDLLVYKVHPLDRGHRDYEQKVRNVAKTFGLESRIRILQSRPLAPLVRHAKGLVTINSTSGIVAIQSGIPVLALGRAFYGIPGIAKAEASVDDLDAFWTKPAKPDPALARTFIAYLKRHHLIAGSFYYRPTWPSMAQAVHEKITSGK